MTRIAPLILASKSKARYHMLRSALLDFAVQDAEIDEAALQQKMRKNMTPADVMAQALAHAKGLAVGSRNPDALVIGADQVLYCNGRIFSKPTTMEEAAEQLAALAGKTHQLISAACLVQQGKVVWSHVGRARLTMREMEQAQIAHYCKRAGDAILRCVGAYEIEGPGVWLFDRIEGEHAIILGMPLFPLLLELRKKGYGL